MNVKDLDLFHEKLYYKKQDFVNLEDVMFSVDGNAQLILPSSAKETYPYVFDIIKDCGEDTLIDMICRNIFAKRFIRQLEAPPQLVMYILMYNNYAKDYLTYPSFYSQVLLDELAYYTVKHKGLIKSEYTFNELINAVLDCNVELLSSTNLKSKKQSKDELGEIFITGAGIGILPWKMLEERSTRNMILELKFNDEDGLNCKVDTRLLPNKYSCLDWRIIYNDGKGTGK